MTSDYIINDLKTRNNNIKEHTLKEYFPTLLNDFSFIWNILPTDMEELDDDAREDNFYTINELLLTYFLEFVKKYAKEELNLEITYELDDFTAICGCAAYDPNDSKIIVSVLGMILQLANNTSFLQPLFHELRHKMQHDYYKEDNITDILKYPTYFLLIEKHHLFIKQFDDSYFYFDNYFKLYPEIDAEEYSVNILNSIIDNYAKKHFKDNDLILEKATNIQEELNLDLITIRNGLRHNDRIENQASDELYRNSPITSYFYKADSLIEVADYIRDNPQLQVEYPVLRLLFSIDKAKDYQELLIDKEKYLKAIPNKEITIIGTNEKTTIHNQIESLYETIIKSDPYLLIEKYSQENNEELTNFLQTHNSLTENNKVKIKK